MNEESAHTSAFTGQVAGRITVDTKKKTTLSNTATVGHGGAITTNSKVLHLSPRTVIDASSSARPSF